MLRSFRWTLLAPVCMVAAHVAFWILIAPVNATMLAATPQTLPPDWMRLRSQWESTPAARAILEIVALGMYAISLLVESPSEVSTRHRERAAA